MASKRCRLLSIMPLILSLVLVTPVLIIIFMGYKRLLYLQNRTHFLRISAFLLLPSGPKGRVAGFLYPRLRRVGRRQLLRRRSVSLYLSWNISKNSHIFFMCEYVNLSTFIFWRRDISRPVDAAAAAADKTRSHSYRGVECF